MIQFAIPLVGGAFGLLSIIYSLYLKKEAKADREKLDKLRLGRPVHA